MDTSLNITRVFGGALRMFREQWRLLMPPALVVYVLPIVVIVLIEAEVLHPLFAILAFSLLLNGTWWFQVLAVRLVEAMSQGGAPPATGALLRSSLRGFTVVSGAGLLAAIGIFFGFLALFVPGVILATWWALAIPVVAVERETPWRALGRSRRLVRGTGNFFEMLAVVAAIGALSGTLYGLAYVVVLPWGSLALALAYFELSRIEAGRPLPEVVTGPGVPGAGQPGLVASRSDEA